VQKLDPIVRRADLAIAAREVSLNGSILKGIVHNIGSTDAEEVLVAVVDTNGATLIRKSLGKLAAPVDLVAKRKTFELRLPRAREKGWRLVLDPEGKVPEIYEGNNWVVLDGLPARTS